MTMITGKTRVFFILGDPVAQVKAPPSTTRCFLGK